MLDDQANSVVSAGAVVLLEVALENDARGQLAENCALTLTMDFVRTLGPDLRHGVANFWRDAVGGPLPADFLSFCAGLIRSLDDRVQHTPVAAAQWTAASDYDHGVYLALAQTLAEITRTRRHAEPSLEKAVARLEATPAALLQRLLMKNYLGNILQDTFDASKVRVQMPELPEDTEEKLREQDAAILVSELCPDDPAGGWDGADLGRLLRKFLAETIVNSAAP